MRQGPESAKQTSTALEPKTQLRAIKCPNCGGSLSLNGGHNVKTLVCNYCGSVLDAKESFKILRWGQKNHKEKKFTLQLGTKGAIKGVEFVVIGVVLYEQLEDGIVYKWHEYLLFSYTHGYAYLVCEDWHWVFFHEIKDLPNRDVKEFCDDIKAKFKARGKEFVVFDSGMAKVAYAEGEFTWQIAKGDIVLFSDSICPPYMYSVERQENEIEYFWGEYLYPKEIEAAFGVSLPVKPVGVGACEPMHGKKIFVSAVITGLIMSVICFFLYYQISSGGSMIFSDEFNKNDVVNGCVSQVFYAKKGVPYVLTVKADGLSNSWCFYEAKVVDEAEENQYCTIADELSYYSGYDDGHWVENNSFKRNFLYFAEDGAYKIALETEGASGETAKPDPAGHYPLKSINIGLFEGVIEGDYTIAWAIILLAASLLLYSGINNFENRRWHQDDEEDD